LEEKSVPSQARSQVWNRGGNTTDVARNQIIRPDLADQQERKRDKESSSNMAALLEDLGKEEKKGALEGVGTITSA